VSLGDPLRVPSLPLYPPTNIYTGDAVSQTHWTKLALAAHHTLGRGAMLLPPHDPNLQAAATRYYRVKPGGTAIARVWAFTLGATGSTMSGLNFVATITCGGASTVTLTVSNSRGNSKCAFVIEPCAKTAALTDLSVQLTAVSGTPQLRSVACWELPRAVLDATSGGVDLSTLESGQPIYDASQKSVRGVLDTYASVTPKRCGLLAYQRTYSTSSTSYVAMMPLAMPVLPSKDLYGSSTRTVEWSVRAYCDVGTTGDVRTVRSDGSVSTSVGVTATAAAWVAGSQSLVCEDNTTGNGGGWETINLQAKRTTGGGSIYVQAFCVYEP
jgi:PKD repeat protein